MPQPTAPIHPPKRKGTLTAHGCPVVSAAGVTDSKFLRKCQQWYLLTGTTVTTANFCQKTEHRLRGSLRRL